MSEHNGMMIISMVMMGCLTDFDWIVIDSFCGFRFEPVCIMASVLRIWQWGLQFDSQILNPCNLVV